VPEVDISRVSCGTLSIPHQHIGTPACQVLAHQAVNAVSFAN